MDKAPAAALATIRLPQPPDELGFTVLGGGPLFLVRFPVVPQVGQLVTYGRWTWLVKEICYDLRQTGPGSLTARPEVRLEGVGETGGLADQIQSGVLVQLLYEENLPEDEGIYIRFPALPQVNEFLFDCRGSEGTRYVVKSVNPLIVEEPRRRSLVRIEYQVVISQAPEEPETRSIRPPIRFSFN